MSEPFNPNEAKEAKIASFPDFVIDAFNELITSSLMEGYATVKQEEVLTLIVHKGKKAGMEHLTRAKVFANNWLDVEDVYRKKGWKVEYDKPAYNETYEPNFKFTAKKKR